MCGPLGPLNRYDWLVRMESTPSVIPTITIRMPVAKLVVVAITVRVARAIVEAEAGSTAELAALTKFVTLTTIPVVIPCQHGRWG